MPRYCAHYCHVRTGSNRFEIKSASNYWQAIAALPVTLYVDGQRYRRQGAPYLHENDKRK